MFTDLTYLPDPTIDEKLESEALSAVGSQSVQKTFNAHQPVPPEETTYHKSAKGSTPTSQVSQTPSFQRQKVKTGSHKSTANSKGKNPWHLPILYYTIVN